MVSISTSVPASIASEIDALAESSNLSRGGWCRLAIVEAVRSGMTARTLTYHVPQHLSIAAEEPGKPVPQDTSPVVVRPENGGADTPSSSTYSKPKRQTSSR